MRRLLLFVVLISCTQKNAGFEIVWEGGKAVAVVLDPAWEFESVSIHVKDSPYEVLGTKTEGEATTFTPSVPFERGQSYDVFLKDQKVYSFSIPADTIAVAPILRASYPSCDTVPSNLLKVYLQFTEPMMEARSSQFVQLFDAKGDTVKNAFLDLQPELWNKEGTVLTLWLDPGRIKQDLIPNKELGVVLNDNSAYQLRVGKGWRSKAGLPLQADYERSFVTAGRDTRKPDMAMWRVTPPTANTTNRVTIDLNETLDWSLLNTALTVWKDDTEIKGRFVTDPCERRLRFEPSEPWKSGTYSFMIEPRIEDLAGNNLDRLFETEVTDDPQILTILNTYMLEFKVK